MTQPWWKTSVVYQVYPRSFADSNGDGIGDLPGLIARLDHIASLGADVLWVSPFYPSPQADNGYDISDYQGVDPLFGSLADVDRLIHELHARDMKLVIDIVANHTSDEHPWFVQSRTARDSAKRDWYWWRPPRAGMPLGSPGAEPNDWRSWFTGPAWAPDERTGEYYLHVFDAKQPDLNWENRQVREAIHAMLRWWLQQGVDGFRFDVINLISKHLEPDGSGYFVDGPRIHEFLREMHEQVSAGRETALLTVGETPGAYVEEARRYSDPRAARGRHGLPVRAHARRPRARRPLRRAPAGPGRAETGHGPVAGGPRRRRLERPLLGQPRPAAAGLALRVGRPGIPSRLGQGAGHRAAPPPGHTVRLPGRGAGDDQLPVHQPRPARRRRVAPLGPGGARAGCRWPTCWPRSTPAVATTRAPPCSGTPVRTPASPPARPGCRSTPTTSRSTPPPRWATPTRCSPTSSGSSGCGASGRSSSTVTSRWSSPTTPPCTRSCAASATSELLVAGQPGLARRRRRCAGRLGGHPGAARLRAVARRYAGRPPRPVGGPRPPETREAGSDSPASVIGMKP